MEDSVQNHSHIQGPSRDCFLHRSRAFCLVALALSAYLFIDAVAKVARPVSFPEHRGRIFLLGPIIGIWVLGTVARGCNQLRERLFYLVWLGYFVIVGIRAALPLSETAVRTLDFVQMTVGVVGIALSAAVTLTHFRRGMHQEDSAN